MKNKKLLSTVVASALVAAQMAVPVMAANGGTVDVDVTTKDAVIRVEVPTSMEIAVDQFELGLAGSQIASSDFSIANKSEVPVKVDVTSKATLGSSVKLVSSPSAVKASTDSDGEAWLAVAAQTSDGKYIEESGKTAGDLTEASANVATFASDSKEASQSFYLNKSTGITEYKLLVPGANGEIGDATYAEFYELSPATLESNDDAGLQKAVDAGDVYVVATADVGKTGTTVTKISKGTKLTDVSITYNGTNSYYTADDTKAEVTDGKVPSGKVYVYAGQNGSDGGKTAFRYIGKLGGAKETWTNSDITKVNITYEIVGVTATNYDEAVKNCAYGLHKGNVNTSVAYTSGKDNSDVVLTFTPGTDAKTLSSNFLSINGVDTSSWSSFSSSFIFDTTNNTITVKSGVFGFSSITGVTTDHKYTFVVKDTDGQTYSTGELDLTP